MSSPIHHLKTYISPKLITAVVKQIKSAPKTIASRYLDVPVKPEVARRLKFATPTREKFDFISKENFESCGVKIVIKNENNNETKPISLQESTRKFSDALLVNTPNKNVLLQSGLNNHIKKYTCLGKGRYGKVVKALYKGKYVALKMINVKENTVRNEENALKLNHENVTKMFDILWRPESSTYGMVMMEYIEETKSLQTVLDQLEDENLMPLTKVLSFAKGISKGLQYCHQNYILHLDLKPKNILLTFNGVCKLCDFGASWNFSDQSKGYKFQGTLYYAAPELLRGEIPTVKCDIFSLGILFWQLLENKSPYSDLNFGAHTIIYQVVKNNLRPKSSSDTNQTFQHLYESCWTHDPSNRIDLVSIISVLEKILLD